MAQSNPVDVRHDRTEVATPPSTKQVEATVVASYAQRRARIDRLQLVLYLLFGVIGVLLAVRFIPRLLGAKWRARLPW